jgi:hypothetical protein
LGEISGEEDVFGLDMFEFLCHFFGISLEVEMGVLDVRGIIFLLAARQSIYSWPCLGIFSEFEDNLTTKYACTKVST